MPIRSVFQKTSQSLLDFFLPPHCLNCKSGGGWLCQRCVDNIPLIRPPICDRCGQPRPARNASVCQDCPSSGWPALDGLRAAAAFEDNPIRPAIHFLKYRNHRAVVSVLGEILADAYRRYGLETEVIIPVPLHPARLNERGYNQSHLLAGEVGKLLGLPVNRTALHRIRPTPPQVGLGLAERRQNVTDAFACSARELQAGRVLLVDDVWTTAATMNACAAALKRVGVSSVWGLTVARAGVNSV